MTLIAPAANALNKGMGIPPLFKTDKSALGITSWVNGPGFLYPDLYGDHIQYCVARHQLAGMVTRIGQGESVNFGPYTVNQHGVSDKKYSSTWSEITQFELFNGSVMFNGSQHRSTAPEPGP
ncbi:DUF6585 family protein [Streptomyces violascens]|uniref:DUF6585 family protein n=1 Tax=Streptomyces violascens TaxID=67381 RepID=UPI0036773B13